jgi:chemosensory pili system protein ChpA (sensor histidine kinase/response regulator)
MTVAARDLTALAWCVGEIRESLARAETALEARLSEPSAEAASARSASSWLHQAHGALRFVELDGVAVLMHQAEQLVAQIEHGERVLDADLLAMLVRAFAATVDYLEAVAAGKADSPVALFSHYRELLVAQGVERIEPADLFVPDLAPMPASLAGLSHQPISAQEAERLKAAFERGLLGFLRQAGDAQALKSMHDTAVRMQRASAPHVLRCGTGVPVEPEVNR